MFDFPLLLAVLEKHINHFALNGFFHILDDEFLAFLDFVLNCFLCLHTC